MENYTPKEISWLSFNERVLQEAQNQETPILERIKFLGIYSNNLDEYFRVRVGTLKRLSNIGKKSIEILGYNPGEVLEDIHEIVLNQRKKFDLAYEEILKDLRKYNIYIINENQLDEEQGVFVKQYFYDNVRPRLMPIMLDQLVEFPSMKNDAIYFAISLQSNKSKEDKYALMEIPTKVLPRFIILPGKGNKTHIIFLDDIIRYRLKDIFYMLDFQNFEAYTVKLTKDAELDINDDISESYVTSVAKSLKRRKEGSPVRFVYDQQIPVNLLSLLIKKLNFKKRDAIIPGSRYHNFKDLINFPDLGREELKLKSLPPIRHKDIESEESIFAAIRKKDIMLHFPFHSFDYFINLLREAAIDPAVKTIRLTVYRLARNSSVINTLVNAARNGKSVTVIIELQARFDEEANIMWAQKLTESGVKVVDGVPGLKVHAKLCLITRKEKKRTVNYVAVGTGNFNENTARIYCDDLLFTTDKKITNEVVKTFNFLDKNYKKENYYHLVLSPFYMRKKMIRMIRNEIKNAREAKKAFIYLKLNNLVDKELILLLYEASQAGVTIRLNVRGMYSAVANKKGVSDNMKARAIVDRFLEHTRIFWFYNGGDEKLFISSADWMTRNMDRRIEVTCPVYDQAIKKELKEILEIQWKDNVQARVLNKKLNNKFYKNNAKEKIRAQLTIYEYLLNLHGGL
ncbi:MAG: polyphosphate kinase 1 [Bacteroidales bacterium]|nr:polyphosphate kinase 1 [Bacteroidales bacterium]